MRSLNIAASGLQAQQLFVDVTSQNLANINTTAYKEQRAEFQDLLYQNLRVAGANSSDAGTIVPTGIQVGLGVRPSAIARNTEQGVFQNTGNTLDFAIEGDGYFQITQPDGSVAYTRDGSFKLSESGELVNSDGFIVEPAITIPQNAVDVNVDQTGQISVTTQGTPTPQVIGQLQTVTFINPAGLQAIGGNLLLETEASGAPVSGTPGTDNFGTILAGFLEASNVDSVTELTNLIRAQRAYEQNAQVITKSDEMLQALNQSV